MSSGGLCLDCPPGEIDLYGSRARTAYGRRDVLEMVQRLEEDDALSDTIEEIAAMTVTAGELMAMADRPPDQRPMGEGERVSALRLTLAGIASAKTDRVKLQMERKLFLTVDDFRSFLAELADLINRTVDDPDLKRTLGEGVSMIRVGRPTPFGR